MTERNPECGCGDEALCNELELTCDPCCRCVPLRLCARFLSEGCDCDGYSSFLEIDLNREYVGTIVCGDEFADLLVYILYENDVCYWHVVSEWLDIDQKFEIGSEKQSCEDPDLTVSAVFEECSGTIEIKRFELARLPPLVTDCEEEPWCGDCQCVCQTLCVYHGHGDHVTEVEMQWDPATWSWIDETYTEDSILLRRESMTGECVAIIEGFDPVPVVECGDKLVFRARNNMDQIVYAECKTCTCQDVCIGCCFPIGFYPGFGWYPELIPFSISAPNCPEADGVNNWFEHTPMASLGACGVCGIYITLETVQIQGQAHFVDGDECGLTPCTVWLCFALECDDVFADPYNDNCCDKVRLILGVSEPFVGTDTPPPTDLIDCRHFIRVAPTSCECDEGGGISAIFELDELAFICNEFFSDGPCYGEPKCCMPIACSLEGATLVI